MLRIALQTLRARHATLAGAFVAIWLAVTLAYATGLLMAGALEAPGPGRFAAADAVVRADPGVRLPGDLGSVDAVPGPRLDAALVEGAAAVPVSPARPATSPFRPTPAASASTATTGRPRS